LAECAEFRQVLAQCLSRLSTRMAQVFWLREAEDIQTAELCEQLKITATSVWAILHRARSRLRLTAVQKTLRCFASNARNRVI
jgi:RNA polymerase sigma-70 factor (ECF subfamily)